MEAFFEGLKDLFVDIKPSLDVATSISVIVAVILFILEKKGSDKKQRNALILQVIMPFMDQISSEQIRKSIKMLVNFSEESNFEGRFYAFIRDRNQPDSPQLEEIDKARRSVVGIFHKIYRLAKTNVVEDEVARAVIGPDSVYLLKHVIEPLERSIRNNYDRSLFKYFYGLYSEQDVEEQGKHDRG